MPLSDDGPSPGKAKAKSKGKGKGKGKAPRDDDSEADEAFEPDGAGNASDDHDDVGDDEMEE